MTLNEFNNLPEREARIKLIDCCGDAEGWKFFDQGRAGSWAGVGEEQMRDVVIVKPFNGFGGAFDGAAAFV